MIIESAIDIFSLIEEISETDEDIIESTKYLLQELKPEGDLYNKLNELLYFYLEEHEYCPKCQSKLVLKSHLEQREYQGFNCYETINELICPKCYKI